jgi:hypothetical protein
MDIDDNQGEQRKEHNGKIIILRKKGFKPKKTPKNPIRPMGGIFREVMLEVQEELGYFD